MIKHPWLQNLFCKQNLAKGALITSAFLSAVCFFIVVKAFQNKPQDTATTSDSKDTVTQAAESPLRKQTLIIEKDSSLYSTLRQANVSGSEVLRLQVAAKGVFDFSKMQAGMSLEIFRAPLPAEDVTELNLHLSQSSKLVMQKDAASATGWRVYTQDLPVDIRPVQYSGQVASNLWQSAMDAGMDPALISELTGVFSCLVDFNREVRELDKWRLVVEEKSVAGKVIGYGNILASEYDNAGKLYSAIRFPQTAADAEYYMPDGTNVKTMFLKSPMRYGHISSRFKKNRFHPILRENRPHNGVDYAAPPGTPVMSVGKGRVIFAGRNGGSGIMLRIRHNSAYETAYLHLQGIAKNIRKGTDVKQGQLIGYVGSTGLANGPHLHFAFFENGRFVDPLGKKFPASDPLPKNRVDEFKQAQLLVMGLLPEWKFADAAKGEAIKIAKGNDG